MKRTVIVFILGLIACGTTHLPSISSESQDAASGVLALHAADRGPPPLDPRENTPFFQQHPLTGLFTLKSGNIIRVPRHGYDESPRIVVGTIDLPTATSLIQAPGYEPVPTQMPDGSLAATAQLWFGQGETDMQVGELQLLLLTLDVRPTGSAAPPFVWVNTMSTVVPMFTGQASHALRALDSSVDDTGFLGEFAGVSAFHSTHLNYHYSDATTESFDVRNADGERVVNAKVRDVQPQEFGAAAGLLTAALGVPSLPPPPPVLQTQIVQADPDQPNQVKQLNDFIAGSSQFKLFDGTVDVLSISTDSKFGRILDALAFSPQVVVTFDHIQESVEPAN